MKICNVKHEWCEYLKPVVIDGIPLFYCVYAKGCKMMNVQDREKIVTPDTDGNLTEITYLGKFELPLDTVKKEEKPIELAVKKSIFRIILNAIVSLFRKPKQKVKDAVVDAAVDEINSQLNKGE